MKLNYIFIYFFVALLLMLNNVNAADVKDTNPNVNRVYKWIDADGHIHYGSRTDNKNAKEIEIKNRYIDSGNAGKTLSAERRVNNQKKFNRAVDEEKKSIAAEKKKIKELEERRIVRCNASRDQLKRAEKSTALYDLDEKGSKILLNKKQYELAIKQTRARVEKWCN